MKFSSVYRLPPGITICPPSSDAWNGAVRRVMGQDSGGDKANPGARVVVLAGGGAIADDYWDFETRVDYGNAISPPLSGFISKNVILYWPASGMRNA